MKKKIFGLLAIVALAIITSVVINCKWDKKAKSMLNFKQIEALALGEGGGGAYVTCRCSRMTVGSCASNNMSDVCAGGNNVQCWTYNANCN